MQQIPAKNNCNDLTRITLRAKLLRLLIKIYSGNSAARYSILSTQSSSVLKIFGFRLTVSFGPCEWEVHRRRIIFESKINEPFVKRQPGPGGNCSPKSALPLGTERLTITTPLKHRRRRQLQLWRTSPLYNGIVNSSGEVDNAHYSANVSLLATN